MKKLFLAVLIVVLFLSFNSFAQEQTAPQQGATQPKTIFDFKQELKLTDKQITDLKDIVAKLQKYYKDKTARLNTLSLELNAMRAKGVKLKAIKRKLQEIARVQVNISYEDIKAGRDIEKTMTPEQLMRWKNMQTRIQRTAK